MTEIEKLEKKIEKKVEAYNADYESGNVMCNDLLDSAEGIMNNQEQLIRLYKEKLEGENHEKVHKNPISNVSCSSSNRYLKNQ